MAAFFGRTQEKKRLARFFSSEVENAALVYGRRRVGKSALIVESLRETGVRALYFECMQAQEAINIESLSMLAAETLGSGALPFRRLDQFLDYLFRQAKDEPLVLVLDEWPSLRDGVQGADSILQSFLDRYRGKSRLKVVLCGSYVSAMEQTLSSRNPLYGRFGLVLKLLPMDYLEASLFYPDFSSEDKVRLYAVFGGIPYYNALIDSRQSVRENLLRLVVSPNARLESEVSDFLRMEYSKIASANSVFDAIAGGAFRFSDILSKSALPTSAALSAVLAKLTDLGILEKNAPINDEGNRKKAGYVIADGLSLFFYRYIHRNLSSRRVMEEEAFFDRFVRDDFETEFVPKRFERICAEFLVRKNRRGEIEPPFEKIGRYRYDIPAEKKNGEFDVVTQDPRGYCFYEAKFRKGAVTGGMIGKEIEQVLATGLSAYRFGFFSRSGFEEGAREAAGEHPAVFYSLDDLYREVP